jgi:hypothetical protein
MLLLFFFFSSPVQQSCARPLERNSFLGPYVITLGEQHEGGDGLLAAHK